MKLRRQASTQSYRYSLTEILNFPEEFLNDKIFIIEYDVKSNENKND